MPSPQKTFYFDPISNIFRDTPEAIKAYQREHNIAVHDVILKYEGGFIYYFLLPNANKPTDKNTSDYSPILRYQFYHVQIKEITDIGFPLEFPCALSQRHQRKQLPRSCQPTKTEPTSC